MLEILVIALLVWLWNIERRLNAISVKNKALQLDLDGLRAMRSAANSERAPPPSTPAGLPEVTSLQGGNTKAATS